MWASQQIHKRPINSHHVKAALQLQSQSTRLLSDLPKLLTSSSEVHADHSISFQERFSLKADVDEIVWSTVCH